MYYVGHGSMFYAEILDDSGQLELKLLVDAGSNSDETGKGAGQSQRDVIRRIMANSTPLIVCITHLHTDHYSFIWKLFTMLYQKEQFRMLKAFYVGSMRFGSLDWLLFAYAADFQKIAYLLLARNKQVWRPLGVIGEEMELWQSADGEVRPTVLLNLLEIDGDENDNSAVFCLKQNVARQMVMFTGATLSRIYGNDTYRDTFVSAVNGYSVWMTVPHHGSIHTLEENDFIIRPGRRGGQAYTSRNLNHCFNKRD